MLNFWQKKLDDTSVNADKFFIALSNGFEKLVGILNKHDKELDELLKWRAQANNVFAGLGCTIAYDGGVSFAALKIDGQTNCYFTGELIAEKATNTKPLYVVSIDNAITKHFYKVGNESKQVMDIDGRTYLFLPKTPECTPTTPTTTYKK